MEHRKSQHPSTVNQCSKYLAGKCFNSSEKCWWMHNDNTKEVILDKIECFICRKTFQSRREVVVHRKSVHVSFVRQCENFKKQNCRFNNESCWFLHGMKTLDEIQEVIKEESDIAQVFQEDQISPKPPYKIPAKK